MAANRDLAGIRLLGGIQLGDDPADIGGTKPRLALAVLALRVGETVPTDTLIEVLWTGDGPADPERSLQVHVSNLRRSLVNAGLQATIEHRGGGYALEVDPAEIDVRRFELMVQEAIPAVATRPEEARRQLEHALSLWRGRPLGALGDHPAFRGELTRLEDLHLRAIEARVDADLATGREEAVIGELRGLAERHPLREGLRARLMLALYRCGRQAEALEAFEHARSVLADELGVDPSSMLRDLHTRVLRQDPSLDPVEPGPVVTSPEHEHPLPAEAVAILPFDVIGHTEDTALFAVGLHNDLLTELSRVPDLTVISRTSVLRYAGARAPIPAIARDLNVGSVVEGTVQSAGARFRLTVQLIDGAQDVHRWAENYDRELTTDDLFTIQTSLAREIARSLSGELTVGAARKDGPATSSLEAYRLAVQGRQQFDLKTEPGFKRAIELFERATELDPGYTDAWVGLADALALMEDYGYGDRHELLPRAEQAVHRAIALDPWSGGAHTSLGLLLSTYQDGPRSIAEFERAIELQPGYADAHNWHSWLSLLVGRAPAARRSARRAVELNPLSAEPVTNLALSLLGTGRPQEALEEARRADELSSFTTADFYLGIALYDLGRFDEARSVLEPLAHTAAGGLTVPWALHGPDVTLALTHVALGEPAAARRILEGIDAVEHPFAAGVVHLGLGDRDAAAAVFRRVTITSAWPTLAIHHHFRELWETISRTEERRHLVRTARRSWKLDRDRNS